MNKLELSENSPLRDMQNIWQGESVDFMTGWCYFSDRDNAKPVMVRNSDGFLDAFGVVKPEFVPEHERSEDFKRGYCAAKKFYQNQQGGN